MNLSTTFSNKKIIVLSVFLFWISGCSVIKDGVAGEKQDSSPSGEGFPIAVLPVYNLNASPAPLKELRQSLIERMKAAGVHILDDALLEHFIISRRLRYVGGITAETAKAFLDETGAGAVLITTLEQYNDRPPPKIALTARLVSTGSSPRILWMKGIGQAGDDSPGLLSLSLIEDPRKLVQEAAGSLTASLAGYLSGERGRGDATWRKEKFRPEVFYRSPVLSPDGSYRVAVVPFVNVGDRKYADEIMVLHFAGQLYAFPNYQVIEPGVVREALLRSRIIMHDGISLADADVLFKTLGVELILSGEIHDYEDFRGPQGNPRVGFSALLIERVSREVVWSTMSYHEGNEGVFFFDLGKVKTAHLLASRMVRSALETLVTPAGK